MKIKSLISVLLVTGTLLATGNALAQTASSEMAVVIESRAITLQNINGLNFGTILPFGRNGTVSVNLAGAATANNAFLSDVSNVSVSTWAVTGVPGAPFNVVLPSSPQTVVNQTNSNFEMTVSNFIRTGNTTNLTLDAAGTQSFAVGATLNVGANQPAGEYIGQFNVTVAYN